MSMKPVDAIFAVFVTSIVAAGAIASFVRLKRKRARRPLDIRPAQGEWRRHITKAPVLAAIMLIASIASAAVEPSDYLRAGEVPLCMMEPTFSADGYPIIDMGGREDTPDTKTPAFVNMPKEFFRIVGDSPPWMGWFMIGFAVFTHALLLWVGTREVSRAKFDHGWEVGYTARCDEKDGERAHAERQARDFVKDVGRGPLDTDRGHLRQQGAPAFMTPALSEQDDAYDFTREQLGA